MTKEELETAYLALCKKVEVDGMKVVGRAGAGQSSAAADAALALVDYACDCRQQFKMRQEQDAPNRFDLAGLNVHADTPSNSETGWEKED